MTYQPETVLARDVVTRWRLLAERRLDHLADLRDSGRWRRYYSEAALAADLREAERAVATWRLLAPLEVDSPATLRDPPRTPWHDARTGAAGVNETGRIVAWRAALPAVTFP
jgi:uncharacterized repeat protein (TIGR03809 family)